MPQRAARSTTILSVRRNGQVALGGDGQVTLGNTVVKHDASKIRRIGGGKVLVGFAGSAADAFSLLERFEQKLGEHPDNTRRAVIELAKDWRTDRALRRLEAMLAVVDRTTSLMASGAGDVIEPTDGVIGIGSGGAFAAAAAKALVAPTPMSAREIVEASLRIAGRSASTPTGTCGWRQSSRRLRGCRSRTARPCSDFTPRAPLSPFPQTGASPSGSCRSPASRRPSRLPPGPRGSR